jgi:hypothetical protein
MTYFMVAILVVFFAWCATCDSSPIKDIFITVPSSPSGRPGDNGKKEGRLREKKNAKDKAKDADPEQEIDSTELY